MFEVYENICGDTLKVAEANISYTLVNPSVVLWCHLHHITTPGSEGTGNEQNEDDNIQDN
jgi:hypothetical protein